MIDKIIRAMQDTGLIDGMSVEDADTIATAALEAMREPTQYMTNSLISRMNDEHFRGMTKKIYTAMIDAALDE